MRKHIRNLLLTVPSALMAPCVTSGLLRGNFQLLFAMAGSRGWRVRPTIG